MTYDAVIFDWDGVITDSNDIKTEAFIELFAFAGPDVQTKIQNHQKISGGISRFKKYQFYMKEYLNHDVSEEELKTFGEKYSQIIHQKLLQTKFIDGVQETLPKLLANSIPAFVVTGSPAEEIKELALKRNILHYFKEIYGSPQTKTDLISHILQKYGFSPQNTLFFGDALTDYIAALNNNINFIGIVTENSVSPFPQNILTQKRVEISL